MPEIMRIFATFKYYIMYNQKYKTAPRGVSDNDPKVVALCDLNSA